MHKIHSLVIKTSLIFAIGLILSASIISFGIIRTTNDQRTIIVKGLAEREVDADLAVWPFSYAVGTENLPELKNQILSKTKIISDFLKKHDLDEGDFTIQRPVISDKSIDPYLNARDSGNKIRYFGNHKIVIHTKKIEAIKNALAGSFALILKEGLISKDGGYESKVNYYFTDLNTIKPSMISEATQNARIAAEKFATDSKSKVGKIKKAHQGMFSIQDAHSRLPDKKNVRVIVTVEYFLAD